MRFKFESKDKNKKESKDMVEALSHIKNFLNKGYLLHGSQKNLEKIIPKQAVDTDKYEATNMNAVYATDDFRIAIIKALMTGQKRNWTGGYSTENKETMLVHGKNITFKDGYIYVLDPKNFKKIEGADGSTEIISEDEVSPMVKIEITPEILKLIPGIEYNLA